MPSATAAAVVRRRKPRSANATTSSVAATSQAYGFTCEEKNTSGIPSASMVSATSRPTSSRISRAMTYMSASAANPQRSGKRRSAYSVLPKTATASFSISRKPHGAACP